MKQPTILSLLILVAVHGLALAQSDYRVLPVDFNADKENQMMRAYQREQVHAALDARLKELEAALAGNSASAWEAALTAAGVPAGRVLTVPEILDHAQVAERGLITTFDKGGGQDRGFQPRPAGSRARRGKHRHAAAGRQDYRSAHRRKRQARLPPAAHATA